MNTKPEQGMSVSAVVRPERCPVTEKRRGGQLVQCILGARHGSARHEFLEPPVDTQATL